MMHIRNAVDNFLTRSVGGIAENSHKCVSGASLFTGEGVSVSSHFLKRICCRFTCNKPETLDFFAGFERSLRFVQSTCTRVLVQTKEIAFGIGLEVCKELQ